MKEKESEDKNLIIENTKKLIIKNSIIAVVIIASFLCIYVIYSTYKENMFSRIWQIATMFQLIVSLVFFEIAYKKDNGIIALNGIEVLVFSCFSLTLEYIKNRFNIDINIYTIIVCGVFVLYFVLKTLIIYTAGRKKELNSLSDIAEIIKEDEPKKKKAIKHKKGEI